MSDLLQRRNNTRSLVWVITLAMLLMHVSERTASSQSVFSPGSDFGPFIPQTQLPATGPTAISGDTALVAADGIVHVFERDPATDAWMEATPLTPSDSAVDFGRSVAIDGARAIVGADGAAYIFRRRNDGVWRQVTKLAASDGNPGFGASVDIDGTHAIVGAPSQSLEGMGAAYVFARTAGSAQRWKEVARREDGGRGFGYILGISGDAMIVGGSSRGPQGAPVYMFDRNQGGPDSWGLVKTLGTPDVPGFVFTFPFLHGVAIAGDRATLSAFESCHAPVFVRNVGGTNAWGHEPMQTGPGFGCGAPLTAGISMSGDKAIYAAGLAAFVIAQNQGNLSPSSFNPIIGGPNAWGRVGVLLSAPSGHGFFQHVSIDGDTALIDVWRGSTGHVEVLVSDIDGDGIRDGRDPCVRDPLNNVAGGCQRASAQYPVLDDLISQDHVTTETRNNRFIITATFTNTSQSAVKNPFFEVTELTGRNVLLNGDAGRGRIGATLSPDVGDGTLSPGESMAVEFVIRLRTRDPFEFRVTLRGEPAS